MISKELQSKLDFYEQVYFALDDPVPFRGGLQIHPVLVKDYYNFYACLPCLTMDKNSKTIIDETGRPKKVSNPDGIAQSYLAYLISQMEDVSNGQTVTQQVMGLFELIFHIKKGFYCPDCGKEVRYDVIYSGMAEHIESVKKEAKEIYNKQFTDGQDHEVPTEVMAEVIQKSKLTYLGEALTCECGGALRDIFSIKNSGAIKKLVIKNVELGPKDFEELKALVPRQNILDYDGDKYLDPDLKEELEIKARLQNKDYTSPTLEKQMVCVAVGTGYSLEYLRGISMRKLSLLLKTVDAKSMYYAQVQAAMSGMVKFKEDPKHWIFTDNRKNIKDELTSLENFEKKFEHVT